MLSTGASNQTIWIEDGQEVWPCRCGETHRGDYGPYDFGHHNCDHGPMWFMEDIEPTVMCSQCGQGWELA